MENLNKKIVLTGGPCAGKTTIAEVLNHAFSERLIILPESASLLFGGGLPRWPEEESRRCLQRAIYHLQIQTETMYQAHHTDKLFILDRGTVDGAAYWPSGSDGFFKDLGTTCERELTRYDRVIYLESAGEEAYEINRRRNPARVESWEEARKLDEETFALWRKHPRFKVVQNQRSFSEKIFSVLKVIEGELE